MKRLNILVLLLLMSLPLFAQNRNENWRYPTWGRPSAPRDGACFYREGYNSGNYFCLEAGQALEKLPSGFNDQITSFQIFGSAQVTLFNGENFGDERETFTQTVRDLRAIQGTWWNDRISSIRVDPGRNFRWGRPADPRDGVCFYKDGYNSDHFCLEAGESLSKLPSGFNDQITAFQIFGEARVTLFNGENFGDERQTFTESVRDLRLIEGSRWNDRISSIRVEYGHESRRWRLADPRDGACFYKDGYNSEHFCLAPGESLSRLPNGFNDQITSFQVFGNAQITVFNGENFGDERQTFTESVRDLRFIEGSRWNDSISSIRVDNGIEPQNGACFYKDSYNSDHFCMNAGESLNRLPDGFNDQITSFQIFGNAQVTVFNGENFGDERKTFTDSVRDLRLIEGSWWNDRISSIRIDQGRWGRSDEPRDGACFYKDGYNSEHFCMNAGESLNRLPSGFNDQVTSFQIFGNAQVTVFNGENFGDERETFTDSVRDLRFVEGSRWNDHISSIRVDQGRNPYGGRPNEPRDGACFYKDGYNSDHFCMNAGDSLNKLPSGFNDQITSFQIFGNAQVTVFNGENFGDERKIFTDSVRDLRLIEGSWWNDRISSIQVERRSWRGRDDDDRRR